VWGNASVIDYYGSKLEVVSSDAFGVGNVLFSGAGGELFPICGAEPIDGFKQYLMKTWHEAGYKVHEF